MRLRESLERLLDGRDLSIEESSAALDEMVSGEAPEALVGAFLVALRAKGETADEIVGLATALRERALAVTPTRTGLVDTCGTGGDGSHTVNISTTAAFVVAGTGLPVAKHGNVGISSRSGSADVLKILGAPMEITPEDVARCIDETGFGFMFAPAFHPAFKHVMPVRRAIGVRTAFNLLGPLINPARPAYQLVGTPTAGAAALIADAFAAMGVERAVVVHGPGADELTLESDNLLFVVEPGRVQRHSLSAADAGLEAAPLLSLRGGTPEENAKTLQRVLDGEPGPIRDCVLLNAGAALVATGTATNVREGVAIARATIDAGDAAAALERFQSFIRSLPAGGRAEPKAPARPRSRRRSL